MQPSRIKVILWTGLLAGTLDGLAAALLYFIRTGKNPMVVYRFIASGVFGSEALSGGLSMGLIGIFFHYTIAMGWTIVFFTACTRLPVLLKNRIAVGITYGIFVWLMMNLVVIPLSRVPPSPVTLSGVVTGAFVLIICIGLPISFMANKYYHKSNAVSKVYKH